MTDRFGSGTALGNLTRPEMRQSAQAPFLFSFFLERTSGDRPASGTSLVAQATDQVIVLSSYFAYTLAALFSFFTSPHCLTV